MHNYTLMDMVRSMLSYFTLPTNLWMEALKRPLIYLIRSLVSRCLKHRMSYGLDEGPHLITFMYEAVLLRLRYLTQMLVN
jgi:hypothetical protein